MKKVFILVAAAFSCTLLFGQAHTKYTSSSLAGSETISDIGMNKTAASAEATAPESSAVTQDARFPGGDQALRAYLAERFEYPQKAMENGIEGTVKVRFTVGADGKPVNMQVMKSVHRIVDNAVVQLIRDMPSWSPRLENGIAVEATVEIPFDLALR